MKLTLENYVAYFLLPCSPNPAPSALQMCLLCFVLCPSRKGKINSQVGLIFKLVQEP